jgi:hypothetical protein
MGVNELGKWVLVVVQADVLLKAKYGSSRRTQRSSIIELRNAQQPVCPAPALTMIVQGRLSRANHVANGYVWKGICGLYGDKSKSAVKSLCLAHSISPAKRKVALGGPRLLRHHSAVFSYQSDVKRTLQLSP